MAKFTVKYLIAVTYDDAKIAFSDPRGKAKLRYLDNDAYECLLEKVSGEYPKLAEHGIKVSLGEGWTKNTLVQTRAEVAKKPEADVADLLAESFDTNDSDDVADLLAESKSPEQKFKEMCKRKKYDDALAKSLLHTVGKHKDTDSSELVTRINASLKAKNRTRMESADIDNIKELVK